MHDLDVGLCVASAAKQRGPLQICPLRAGDRSSQLFIGEPIEELNPLLAHVTQRFNELLKPFTATRLHLVLVISIHERGAFLGRVASAGETDGIGVVCHQSLSYGEESQFALDNVSKMIIRAPRGSARVLTGRYRSPAVGSPNETRGVQRSVDCCLSIVPITASRALPIAPSKTFTPIRSSMCTIGGPIWFASTASTWCSLTKRATRA
jgi:hypothetical protein